MEKSLRNYTSHDNKNEMLEIMARHDLKKILGDVQASPFLALMADKTADVASKEQLTLVIRGINKNLDVFEEFLEMYCLSSTTADSITSSIKMPYCDSRYQYPKSEGVPFFVKVNYKSFPG